MFLVLSPALHRSVVSCVFRARCLLARKELVLQLVTTVPVTLAEAALP